MGQRVDVLFIDGSHDYDDVLVDIDLWFPILVPGGVVAFNDPYAPGVNRAIRERIMLRGVPIRDAHHVNNTLFIELDSHGTVDHRTVRKLWSYLFVERISFRLLKLLLKGFFETVGIVYVPERTARSTR